MDEFGVLTESFGLKPQGKAAPMAASKRSANAAGSPPGNFAFDSVFNQRSSSYSGSVFDFPSDVKTGNHGGLNDFNDLFGSLNVSKKNSENIAGVGSSLGIDSIFTGSSNLGSKPSTVPVVDDDIFGGMPKFMGSASSTDDDLLGSFSSSQRSSDQIDDLLGGFMRNEAKVKSSKKPSAAFDELIPGFGGSAPPKKETGTKRGAVYTTESLVTPVEDPFIVLESTGASADLLDELGKLGTSGGEKPGGSTSSSFRIPPVPKPVSKAASVKSSSFSPIDELESFAMGSMQNGATQGKVKASASKASRYSEAADAKRENHSADDLESFFAVGPRSKSVPRSRVTTPDPVFDGHMNKKQPAMPQKTSPASTNIKKSSSVTNLVDDLSTIFGASPLYGEFQEIEGESEERRRARLGRQQRTQERAARAVADMNQRDFQAQLEQEARQRIAESLDIDIKRWAAGKEGNMRALLSSLHYVVWPECGWEPVSLTDMITSGSVKKVYRKATLCIHPDKVQQRGVSLEQKYTAEKVFDILKEAWAKFNKEELS